MNNRLCQLQYVKYKYAICKNQYIKENTKFKSSKINVPKIYKFNVDGPILAGISENKRVYSFIFYSRPLMETV